MSSGMNTCWCYRCSRPIRLHGGVCPYCDGGFVQKLDYSIPISPQEFFRDQRLEQTDAFPPFLRQYFSNRNQNREGFGTNSGMFSESEIPFRLPQDGRFEAIFSGAPRIMVTPGNYGDYSEGPGLEEVIQQVSASDHKGPPPASSSSINAIPFVKITQKHLRLQTKCPICQESFEVGSKVKQMPCNHMFDADCITSWLVQRNTCPVCREELPPEGSCSSRGSTRHGSGSNNRRGLRRHHHNHRRHWWALC